MTAESFEKPAHPPVSCETCGAGGVEQLSYQVRSNPVNIDCVYTHRCDACGRTFEHIEDMESKLSSRPAASHQRSNE